MSSDYSSRSKWRIWLLAARPKTLWAVVAPVIIGGALALDSGSIHPLSWMAALAGALLIQIGTNFANDLFDHEKAVDTKERRGPLRVTQAGLVRPAQMRLAMVLVFGLAFLVGIYLVWRGGWPIVIIGLLSILCGVLYTGGPYPLGYHGLGDILVLIFFGPVAVGGTYYVTTLAITGEVLLVGLPAGMLATAILTVNNLRDIDTDAASGKHTLAVRWGHRFTRVEYLVMVCGAALFPLFYYALTSQHRGAMLAVITLVAAIKPIKRVLTSRSGEVLNTVLADTGKLAAFYAITFSIGWLL
ncbi:MAG: 1,4-dihydroxy-2-naphthoate polyprenyltransferase [candidate division Zixibacteria bacterium]|nr:1,4-dihydroxy-2-naphthoate polyprenyltransferase [candidate division Zixibacteria bacterium]